MSNTRPPKPMLWFNVTISINEPSLAMTATYRNVRAMNSMDASQQATDAARQEFGGNDWNTERIEMTS